MWRSGCRYLTLSLHCIVIFSITTTYGYRSVNRRIRIFIFSLICAGAQSFAQRSNAPVIYDISFPNAVHHEAEITVTWAGLPKSALEVRMSRSSPGRYALHEFAKNVYN